MQDSLSAGRKALIIAALLGVGAGAVAGASTVEAINAAGVAAQPPAPRSGKSTDAVLARPRGALADLVEAVGPAVVQIEARAPEYAMSGGLEGYYGPPAASQRGALGSGFVIDPSGIIVTNNHVVADAEEVAVKFRDGREVAGRVIGRDARTDLAVIRVTGSGPFPAIKWGDSDELRVGDDVFAVGSPFGLGNSVTSGILSARGREIGAGPYDDFLQVDAAINSGNSGGPLFDRVGRVIGVNTAIVSPTGGNVGVGFAIPSRMARSIVDQIIADGHVSRGRIGVELQPLTPDIARSIGFQKPGGALVAGVEPGSPAEDAGLLRGDVITAFAGRPVDDSRALARAVAEARIGSTVAATVVRGGRSASVRLKIVPLEHG